MACTSLGEQMPKKSKHTGERAARRDAINAVRLSWLGPDAAAVASTVKLSGADVVAAQKLFKLWPPYRDPATTEEQQVEYLLSTGWKAKGRH